MLGAGRRSCDATALLPCSGTLATPVLDCDRNRRRTASRGGCLGITRTTGEERSTRHLVRLRGGEAGDLSTLRHPRPRPTLGESAQHYRVAQRPFYNLKETSHGSFGEWLGSVAPCIGGRWPLTMADCPLYRRVHTTQVDGTLQRRRAHLITMERT